MTPEEAKLRDDVIQAWKDGDYTKIDTFYNKNHTLHRRLQKAGLTAMPILEEAGLYKLEKSSKYNNLSLKQLKSLLIDYWTAGEYTSVKEFERSYGKLIDHIKNKYTNNSRKTTLDILEEYGKNTTKRRNWKRMPRERLEQILLREWKNCKRNHKKFRNKNRHGIDALLDRFDMTFWDLLEKYHYKVPAYIWEKKGLPELRQKVLKYWDLFKRRQKSKNLPAKREDLVKEKRGLDTHLRRKRHTSIYQIIETRNVDAPDWVLIAWDIAMRLYLKKPITKLTLEELVEGTQKFSYKSVIKPYTKSQVETILVRYTETYTRARIYAHALLLKEALGILEDKAKVLLLKLKK